MANMMSEFVRQELENEIKEHYPHMRYPPCMRAKVVSVRTGSGTYTCTLKILDKNGQADNSFPEIPMVQTDIEVSRGDTVIVLLLYGECDPFILRRCG